jgi:dehydrogenase/reductase SDR family protein 4
LKVLKSIEEKHGKIDVLVSNHACSTHFGSQLSIEEGAYDKLWDLNVKATFFLIKESFDLLKKAGKEANILVISSVAGTNPHPTLGVYGMTKAALDNMVKWMSKELMYEDIRVNGLAPGLILTEFSGPLWKGNEHVPKKS